MHTRAGSLRRRDHGCLAFSALKAAMVDPQRPADPLLAREYLKLFTVASRRSEVCVRVGRGAIL
jgi:hypothetical protein